MTAVRVSSALGAFLALLICVSCGDTYRPIAFPVTPNPPNPAFNKAAFVLLNNGMNNPGNTSQIDVSGDTVQSVAKNGVTPVHIALTPDSTKLYVANEYEDTISSFPPGTPNANQLNPVTTISLAAGSHPIFLAGTQNTAMYVANNGNATVAVISQSSNVVTQIIPLGSVAPVAMAETPNGSKLYVANQGNGTAGTGSVSSINPTDNSLNPVVVNSWISPVWVVARSDSARAYVLDSGAGKVFAIDTSTDKVLAGAVPVGIGANFMFYDKDRNRVYVTNPANGSVSIIDVSVDPPSLLATDCVVAGFAAPNCPTTFAPVSVAVLPDGSSAYVGSYQLSSPTCAAGQTCSITSQATVINANSNAVSLVIPLGSVNVDTAINPVTNAPDDTGCNPATSTHPARFRLSVAAAGDSSRVYVSICDAGSTTVISAVPTSSDPYPANTVITAVSAPLSSFPPPASNPAQPPPQNPVFILASP